MRALRGLKLGLAAVLCCSCVCRPGNVAPFEPARLSAAPSPLALPDGYVGQSSSGLVSVTNAGGAAATLEVSISAPFTVEPATITVTRGETVAVTVRFTAAAAGRVDGVLKLGALEVPVSANGLAVPQCPTPVCAPTRFDFASATCVSVPGQDGVACESVCVADGVCLAGACHGQPVSCDDQDACTNDSCSDEAGCLHLPRVCPPSGASCQSAVCDSSTGCGVETAIDGTLCGVDNCEGTTVDVCIVGQCVERPRADQGRCVNTWMPVYLSPRFQQVIAFDAARQRTVLFGGGQLPNPVALADTWEWDGSEWKLKTPASAPPARWGHAMAYDPLRQRVLLFGGAVGFSGTALGDTWEWDGTTWVQRLPSASPPARFNHALAFDSARNRLVLFGGFDSSGAPLGDTWEWNGSTWSQRVSASAPGARANHALAYDAARHRTVLFGGVNSSETWEWDGTSWLSRPTASAPSARSGPAMAWDPARQRVVLVGGLANGHPMSDTWEWDGLSWSQRALPQSPPEVYEHALTYDSTRSRLVLLGGRYQTDVETWELDSASWSRKDAVHPFERNGPSMGWDSARGRLVLFGGWATNRGNVGDTWEWDGTTWLERTPETSPAIRSNAGAAWDPVRQRLVLFGGNGNFVAYHDTWEWDGTTWLLRAPAVQPAGRSTALAFDPVRGRAVFFGGEDDVGPLQLLADTWEWDGQTWLQRNPSPAPSARFSAFAWDRARQQAVLFGGSLPQANVSAETWLWNGSAWSQPTPTTAPPARRFHALAYDPDRQRVLLFGGETNASRLTDTWEWDGAAWRQLQPAISPPPTTLHAMTWDEKHKRIVLFGSSGMWWFLP